MNQILNLSLPGTQEDPRYPDSDGRFMGETDFHNKAIIWLREALEDHFATVSDVYVATNLVFYYEYGSPRRRRDPDGLVAKGVGKYDRRAYRLWEEKIIPCTLFEIASKNTWRTDVQVKRNLYAEIGVKEYFVFDPEGKYVKPRLRGFRTSKGKPVTMKPAKDGSLVSKELGLRMVPDGIMLRFIDLATGKPILTRSERAEQERLRAEQEKLRAEQEKLRADALSAELTELRKILESKKKNGG
jgi:Uma2 family endonuclease